MGRRLAGDSRGSELVVALCIFWQNVVCRGCRVCRVMFAVLNQVSKTAHLNHG